MPIRSGRFAVADASQGNGIRIISGHSGAYYRMFNSGKNPFIVRAAGPSTPASKEITLAPKYSIDVAIDQAVLIRTTTAVPVEGIYEYLTPSRPVRSGRFRFFPKFDASGNPEPLAYPHNIIALFDNSDSAWYRIFNSGQVPIIMKAVGSGAQVTIEKEQSFDFEVGNAFRVITVEANPNTEPIQGMYDFLGRED
jgi:hypothetical protein